MIFFFVFVVAAGFLLEWLSLRKPIEKLTYHARPEGICHEPDERFTVETVIENHSRRNLSGIRLSEHFPATAKARGGVISQSEGGERVLEVTSVISVKKGQRLVRRRHASISDRGRYIFSGAEIFAEDFLGMTEKNQELSSWEEVVVYPKSLSDKDLKTVLDGFYGDYSVRRFLIEDPMLIRGFHEYTGTEPMKAISWTQTARRQTLMAKEFDYTQELTATVVLNVHNGDFAGADAKLLEMCYCLVRTVCEYLTEREVFFRFFHNVVCGGQTETGWQFPDLGNNLEGVLEALGRATYFSAGSFEKLIERAKRESGERHAFYLITPEHGEESEMAEKSLGEDGASVLVLYASDYVKREEDEA